MSYKNSDNQNSRGGFGAVEVILLIAVLVALGLVGYRVWQARQTPPNASLTPAPILSRDSPSVIVPPISSVSGLDSALQTLDGTKFDAAAESQLNSQLSF